MPSRPAAPLVEPSELTLADAALLFASGQGAAGRRLQRAVEAQLIRRDLPYADRDDVRADVGFALLVSPRRDRISLDAACAHVSIVARNKAIDHHRRRARELPAAELPEHAAVPVTGPLARDLDAVSGEVHRRDVARALVELVRELPAPERRALAATATGAGAAGSGLGRSSHYRALGRARLRLTSAVRSRVAAGLALPALYLRNAAAGRGLLASLGAALAAGAASVALVLPAIELPRPVPARATVAAPLTRVVASVPAHARALATSRAPATARRRARAHVPTPAAAPAVHRVRLRPRPIRRRVLPRPSAGLGPCRAAHLCQ